MASAAAGIADRARRRARSPHRPRRVVANHDGAAYADADGWRARSAEHVTVPVRWRTSMETLAALGADAFVEVGHGSMIAGLAKRTVPDVPVFSCADPRRPRRPCGGTRIVTVPPGHRRTVPEPSPAIPPLAGETLAVAERMIVAPGVGIFRPHDVGRRRRAARRRRDRRRGGAGHARARCCSPFGGTLMGMLAHPGERLRSGQPDRVVARRVTAAACRSRSSVGARPSPTARCTNADLEARVDTNDAWIVERTGIRERRIAAPGRDRGDARDRGRGRRDQARRALARPTSTCWSSRPRRPTSCCRTPARSSARRSDCTAVRST